MVRAGDYFAAKTFQARDQNCTGLMISVSGFRLGLTGRLLSRDRWQGHTWQIIEVLWEYRLYVCDRLVWKESSMVESSDDKASPWDAHYRIDPITVGGEILEQKTDQLEARLVALEKAVSHLSKAVMVLSRVIDYNMKLDGKS
jgi:hypothetical protein